jgi:hypothetical protein
MSRSFDANDEHALRRRGTRLLYVAVGAALGALLIALGAPGAHDARAQAKLSAVAPVYEKPAQAPAPALDAGVDWNRVELAPDAGQMAVAAYER